MYYFGTNLDEKFSVPDFWPKPEQTYKIPFEREEMDEALAEFKERRLANRARRLEMERRAIEEVKGSHRYEDDQE